MCGQARERWQRGDGYKAYVLALLVLVYAVNIMDRQVLSLLLEDIKAEFALSDSQLGLLGGASFAFFYSFLGIPLARWADKGSKRRVLSGCILVWSVATACCALATGFISLLAARVATAVGEAGGSPASHALISAYFPARRRATALSIFALGVPLGGVLGNLASGWLHEFYSWREVFAAVAAPGLLVALVFWITVKEDEESAPCPGRPGAHGNATLKEAVAHLWRQKLYVHMCLAAALHSVAWYAGGTWNAAFLMRSHGLGPGEAGTLIASFSLLGLIGTFVGGFLSDRLVTRFDDARWYLWLPGLCTLSMVPLQLFSYLSESLTVALVSFWIMSLLASTFFGPSYAVSQAAAAPDARALASSILIFTQTLIGLGIGPLLAGGISDSLQASAGSQSLRYALVFVGLANLWSACHYFVGARSPHAAAASAGALEIARGASA